MKEQIEFFDKDKEVFVCYLDEENKATNSEYPGGHTSGLEGTAAATASSFH